MNQAIDRAVEPKVHAGDLYSLSYGPYVGVLVDEAVMKKIVKSRQKHIEECRSILSRGAESGGVFPYMWTLHYPGGEQTTVIYIDQSSSAVDAIERALRNDQLVKHHPRVFVASSMNEAAAMADAYSEAGHE